MWVGSVKSTRLSPGCAACRRGSVLLWRCAICAICLMSRSPDTWAVERSGVRGYVLRGLRALRVDGQPSEGGPRADSSRQSLQEAP